MSEPISQPLLNKGNHLSLQCIRFLVSFRFDRVFNPLLSVWKCGKTRSPTFNILPQQFFLLVGPAFCPGNYIPTSLWRAFVWRRTNMVAIGQEKRQGEGNKKTLGSGTSREMYYPVREFKN